MPNKKIVLFDGCESKKENISFNRGNGLYTDIDVVCHETGELLFRGHNKVIISGSEVLARELFDISADPITPTYNTDLALVTPAVDTASTKATNTKATKDHPKILLFCVGVGGCGEASSQVYTVDYRKRIDPADMVPFRYQLVGSDLSASLRESYFGRKEIGTNYIAYYFKRFEDVPEETKQFIDGTLVDSGIFATTRTEEAETFVTLKMQITKDDLRDFFTLTTGIDSAKINTISLCTAYPVVGTDGYIYFNDIRPFTKLNIPNESMSDVSKGIDIIYHIYM